MQFFIRSESKSGISRKWPLLLLSGTLVGGGSWAVYSLQSTLRKQAPALLEDRLEAALGRPVEFGAFHLSPTGVWFERFRVPAQAGDPGDPIAAKRLSASVDWWHLLTAGKLRVGSVGLDGLQVKLFPGKGTAEGRPWTAQVVDLGRSGVERFHVRDGAVQYLSLTGAPAWSAKKVSGDLRLTGGEFRYQGRVGRLENGGVVLADVRAAGSGSEAQVRLASGSAAFGGGRFAASGLLKPENNEVDLTLRVEDMPLGRVAPQIGIPATWAMKGRLSGELVVDARSNALKSVRGSVHVDRGSLTRDGAQLPWEAANAQVEWTPETTRLKDVQVEGKGLRLTGAGSVVVAPGKPFTAGVFQVDGHLAADQPGAVKQVAELLAFRKALDGRWEAQGAEVGFSARGIVGDLSRARANGRLTVRSLEFRPTPEGERVVVSSLTGDVERTPEALALRNVEARTEGIRLAGALSLASNATGAGTLKASGELKVQDLKSLREAVPQSNLWKWIPVASPDADGTLAFRVEGPASNPRAWKADGTFRAADFRLSARSPLPNGADFFIPVRTAAGEFHYGAGRLQLDELDFRTATFDATGRLAVEYRGQEPDLALTLRVATGDWRGLPAMPVDALPELQGGRLEGEVTLAGTFSHLSQAPVFGSLKISDAVYRPAQSAVAGAEIPVRSLAARFRWDDRVLHLPFLSVDSPALSADAQGRIYQEPGQPYRLALEIDAEAGDAGALVGRFTDALKLEGGAVQAKVQLDSPVSELAEGTITGSFALTDGELRHAVAPLGLETMKVSSLAGDFAGRNNHWELNRLALAGPGLELSGEGKLAASHTDAAVRIKSDRWSAGEALPVSGGNLSLEGRLVGDPGRLEKLAFNGDAVIDGARARLASSALKVTGGRLRLDAHGEGPVSDLASWVCTGSVRAEGAEVSLAGIAPLQVKSAETRFARSGDGFEFTGARLAAAGLAATARGLWSPERHEVELDVTASDPAKLGLALPQMVKVGKSHVTATLHGTPAQPVERVKGNAELSAVRLSAAGLPAQELESLAGAFEYGSSRLRFDRLEGRGPAGAVSASGEWGPDSQRLALTAAGKSLAALGVELPEGFSTSGYELRADVAGTAAAPLSRAEGDLRLTGFRLPFGPEGPHDLGALTSRFRLAGGRVLLEGIRADGPAAAATGSGEVTEKGYRLSLAASRLSPAFARWLVPGTLTGGQISGTLAFSGVVGEPVKAAQGTFRIADASYVLPEATTLAATPVRVRSLTGDYRWTATRTELTGLKLDSGLLTATGSMTVSEESGTVNAELKSGDLGQVADYWPNLKGWVEGAAGGGNLQARWDPSGVRGSLALSGSGGKLVLPSMPGEYAEHPIEKASMLLGFEPGKLTFTDVVLRGAKGNLDGEGVWTDAGPVFGKGKAWFSKSYTSKLMKPTGFGWLAKLFGLREIKSDFEIGGTSDRVTLNAGITKSFIWKFAKGKVPKEFQAVAAGKAPLWVRTEEAVNTVASAEE